MDAKNIVRLAAEGKYPNEEGEDIKKAVWYALRYGQVYGEHHKMWVIDKMLRALLGEDYDSVIQVWKYGDGNENEWDTGNAPMISSVWAEEMKKLRERRRNVICTNCGKKCYQDKYPEIVFRDESQVICEECSIDFDEIGEKVVKRTVF